MNIKIYFQKFCEFYTEKLKFFNFFEVIFVTTQLMLKILNFDHIIALQNKITTKILLLNFDNVC